MQLELESRVVVVTGGASGIGLACMQVLAEEGAIPICLDRNPPPETTGFHSVTADITDFQALELAAQEIADRWAAPFGLVHAAAIGSGHFGFPFTNLHPHDWRQVLEVNIMGTTNIAHALAPKMIPEKCGAMVFIASISGQIGSQTDPPYSASKAANINFAQCLAKDLAPHNIRVNTVCPGMVQTPLNRSVWQAWHDAQPPEAQLSYDQWAGDKVKALIPLGRWQQTRDIAEMVVFLLSQRAQSVTGQTINVDGGFVMHW